MAKPSKPFEVYYIPSKPREPALPAKWAIPFDTEFRDIDLPNDDEAKLKAYASIGAHVVEHAQEYAPAYHVVAEATPNDLRTTERVKWWESTNTEGTFVITDRRTGRTVRLLATFSYKEAAVSWFARGLGNEHSVLCYDVRDEVWYVEAIINKYVLALDSKGSEIPIEEANGVTAYALERHQNAIMLWGE